ncbi:HAD family hydrolase [Candidatus Micrarchaeota archaeon]|nr:HAD family hydrolase [Candidatus Micrarchaeota archaeon]
MKTLIFDFDGVLMDSREAYVSSFAKVLTRNGFDVDEKKASAALLPSAPKTIEALVGRPDNFDELVAETRKHVAEKESGKIKICEGAGETIGALSKRFDLFLITNSSKAVFDKVIKKIPEAKMLAGIITSSDGFASKEDAINHVLKERGERPSGVYYVGDTMMDIETAKKVGCKSAIVYWKHSWDYGKLGEIKKMKPAAIVGSLEELENVLE